MENTITLKNYYVMKNGKGIDYTTISGLRKDCISKFTQDTAMTWKELQVWGWRCEKVNITFKTIK